MERGREGLFNLVKSTPATLKYESSLIVAEGDFVILHGRFSGIGLPVNWIAADFADGKRHPRRALGRNSGRGDQGAIEEQAADVRFVFSRLWQTGEHDWIVYSRSLLTRTAD